MDGLIVTQILSWNMKTCFRNAPFHLTLTSPSQTEKWKDAAGNWVIFWCSSRQHKLWCFFDIKANEWMMKEDINSWGDVEEQQSRSDRREYGRTISGWSGVLCGPWKGQLDGPRELHNPRSTNTWMEVWILLSTASSPSILHKSDEISCC